MLFVKVSKDIMEYEPKFMLGLTMRQFITLIVTVVIAIGSYFVFAPIVGQDLMSWILMLEVSPMLATGFLKIRGMPFEKYGLMVIRHTLRKQKITYDNEISWEREEKNAKTNVANKIAKKIRKRRIRENESEE